MSVTDQVLYLLRASPRVARPSPRATPRGPRFPDRPSSCRPRLSSCRPALRSASSVVQLPVWLLRAASAPPQGPALPTGFATRATRPEATSAPMSEAFRSDPPSSQNRGPRSPSSSWRFDSVRSVRCPAPNSRTVARRCRTGLTRCTRKYPAHHGNQEGNEYQIRPQPQRRRRRWRHREHQRVTAIPCADPLNPRCDRARNAERSSPVSTSRASASSKKCPLGNISSIRSSVARRPAAPSSCQARTAVSSLELMHRLKQRGLFELRRSGQAHGHAKGKY